MYFPTSHYTSSLPNQAAFSAVLLLAFISFRISWIVSSILISNLFISLKKDRDKLEKIAKWGLIGKFVGFVVLLLSTAVKIGTAFIHTIITVFYSFVPFIVLAFVFMMVQQRWGDGAVMVTSMLNDPESPVSLTITYFIRFPLQVLDDVAFYVIPFYNFLVFIIIHIPLEFFANFVFGAQAQMFRDGISYFAQSISLVVQATGSYVRSNTIECPSIEPICWNSTIGSVQTCMGMDKSTVAASCLGVHQRQFDGIPFLMAMMNGFSNILKGVALGCSSLETVINLFCFPLTDPSLWKAINYALNSILHALVGAPTATSARCSLGGGFSTRPSLCTPDFGPVFDFAVSAVHALGDVIDNFFDMIYLLVIYGKNAECPSGSMTQHSLFLPLWDDPFMRSLFGSNSTSLVTLSTSLFAITDGYHSVYVTHKKKLERSYYPGAWGASGINPRFGIAAVKDKAGEIAMLGCRCVDTPKEMVVQCSTSASGVQSVNTLSINSTWEVVKAGSFMQCSSVRILVQSIRWPESRVSMAEQLGALNIPQASKKLIADAVVYVIPTCGGDSNSLSCLDPKIFTLSNCYPFCMALHTKNVGVQPLLFRGYNSWKNGVLIVDRDCVPIGSIQGAPPPTNSDASSTTCSSEPSSTATTGYDSSLLQCKYNAICSSWVSNKTLYSSVSGSYFSASTSIPSFADTSRYVKNILDGQPLVAAGGVIMRVSMDTSSSEQRYVDFPMITGDQQNEFSLEIASPVGIPVAPVAEVIALGVASERKGFISLPPNYIEMVDISNPATLSTNALWYAVNPSYDWIYCFTKYCATEGRDTCVQLMMFSSYTPIRLWRVNYKTSACFIRAEDGMHVCRDDVAQGFALDPPMDIPKFGSTDEVNSKIGSYCSDFEFNLWVESMEYFDELNIAVSVRRGSMKALYNLMQNVMRNSKKMNVSTMGSSKWYKSEDVGRIVVYFVHTLNTSLVRPLEPWTSLNGADPGFLSVVHGSGSLCPELRFLPSFGTFFAESLSAVILGVKMPVNFLSNLFALGEVLISRTNHACPADGLGHSVLEDCGMGLFDLSSFFYALQEGNKAFWSIVAWFATVIQLNIAEDPESASSASAALNYFEGFITGAAVYGEAGHIVSLFQVHDVAENLFDTGIQENVLGGRRRLLSSGNCAKLNSNYTGRKLLGSKQISQAAARGLLSGIMNVFSGGVKTLFSISHSLVDATTLSMSSADFGVLLSTTNPTYILGSAVTAPGIVWAQFTYETILPMALDLASTVIYGHSLPKSTAVLWVHLHAAKDNFEKLIEPRMEQGCEGLRLMLGYSGGLAGAVYHNCISASKMHSALFSLIVLISCEVPFYSCMCVQSSGNPFPDYILANCMDWVPDARKGLWQSVIQNSGQDSQSLCNWYGGFIHDNAMHTFDKWTTESHLAASSLGSFLQDLIVPNAREMGSCTNVKSNPNIFVMLPIPSEHYHVCGKTTECRLRCADTFALFEYELNRYKSLGYTTDKSPQTFDVSAESPFFNPYQSSGGKNLYYIEDRILALSSRNRTSSYTCGTCPIGCAVVVKSQWEAISSLSVTTYCIPPPADLRATIYEAGGGSWIFENPLTEPHFTMTYCNFALQEKEMYLILAYSSAVMTVSSSGILSFDSNIASTENSARNQQKLFAVRHDVLNVFQRKQKALTSLILDSESLTTTLLSSAIQDYVFEQKTVYNAYVKECQINELIEIATGVPGKLQFFITVMFTANGWVKQEDISEDMGFITDEQQSSRGSNAAQTTQQILKTGYIAAIVSWCDSTVVLGCRPTIVEYFLPCFCADEQGIFCQKPEYTHGSGCRPGIDAVIYLAQRGTFLHVQGNVYIFLPKEDAVDSSGSKLLIQYVEISPDGNHTKYPVKPPSALQYPRIAPEKPIRLYVPSSTTKAQLLRQEMGFWSHSDVFANSGLAMRILRSPILLNLTAFPIRWLQASQPTSTAVQWLKEVRILLTKRGFELVSTSSQNTTAQAIVKTKCSPYDCSSCVAPSVRLVCHALQDCMLSRCIGTTVNYKNLLCSIGIVVEQLYMQMVTSWRAIYLFLVEISMFVLNGFGGSLSQKIVLSFPTDTFYSLVCACKDVFASFIGMTMSAVENVHGLLTTGRIDISINSYVSPRDAIFTTQMRTIGGLFFNIVADATLYPVLAMHRWLICITNTTVDLQTVVSVQFGDLGMDQSWGMCSSVSSKLSLLMDATEFESLVQGNVDGFISYSMSLLSGIGETVLYGMILVYDGFISFLESIVWNIQNIMQAFNLRTCKVTDYMQRVVLQCACGDAAYYIPKKQREGSWRDGALWCSGSLAVTLTDGSQGIIYNPYSLQELSDGLSGITEYIQCLATSTSSQECKKVRGISTLGLLTNQGVEPIAVWAKCKSNYLEQTWDIGTGALFSDNIIATGISPDVSDVSTRRMAQEWARAIAPEFLQCMQAPQRFYNDYSVCLTMYLNMTTGRLPNALFLLMERKDLEGKEPPDACMVFSGLNQSSDSTTEFKKTMQHCIMDPSDISADPSLCPFNPTVWMASDPRKIPVAKLLGILETGEGESVQQLDQKTQAFYRTSIDKLRKSFDAFNQTFLKSAKQIQVALFSADGDFIHDFIDCVFLGPYTRVDMLPCDNDGVLECPFYARDEGGGIHRNFSACFGDLMHGDGELPFTCGSQTRRALIKYFFRVYSWAAETDTLDSDLTLLIQSRINEIMLNITNPYSFGCLDAKTGVCSGKACTLENEYRPCLDMEFAISASNVSKFILQKMLLKVDSFYAKVMHDTAPWTKYYNVSKAKGQQPLPAQWGQNTGSANKAQEEGIFMAMEPVVKYDQSDVYTMPTHADPHQARFDGSLWSLCMALISQGQMSLAVGDDGRPLGADDAFLNTVDWYDLESVASAVRNFTRKAAERSPFIWHKARYHAPSKSGVCKKTEPSKPRISRINIGAVEFDVTPSGTTYKIPFPNNLSIPFHGFTWGMLGNAHETCLCGYDHVQLPGDCVMSSEACVSILAISNNNSIECISTLQNICRNFNGQYSKGLISEIWACLHSHLPKLRCPELGPSDSWGLFPMDCDGSECASAKQWGGNAQQDVLFEGIRLATEGRAGLKLSNIEHVNSTYHDSINYAEQSRPATDYQIKKCFHVDELTKTKFEDSSFDALQDWIQGLFPATQLHYDSPVLAYCSRFVIEVARAEALSYVSNEASLKALQDAKMWKRKCHTKVKHLTMCSRLGMFYDIPPPQGWKTNYSRQCDVSLDDSWADKTPFMTPWCIIVDQQSRTMYDARKCLRNAMSAVERQNTVDGNGISARSLYQSEINEGCQLSIQPLDLLLSDVPISSLFVHGAKRLSLVEGIELSTLFDASFVQNYIEDDGLISHVLDWWPSTASMPVGFHVTAPMIKEELAPFVYDTHYAFDPSTFTVHYIHSALRDQSLLPHTSGTGGLCRVHTVGMPIFETNTNRICSRMPKKGVNDSPHLPVDAPKTESNIPPIGPYSSSVLKEYFEDEYCASTYEDVPWPKQSESFEFAGSIPLLSNYLKMDKSGRCAYASTFFPPSDASLLPVKGMYNSWGDCGGAVMWDDSPTCTTSSDCPRNTLCLKKEGGHGVCFSTAAFRIQNSRPPCFRTDHCADGLVCLADGGCSPLFLHMWNAPQNGIQNLEFALMADECGFQNSMHPFTQNMRGVSPWEQIPDLLHMHGLCSHRNWFAYRNAWKDQVCSHSVSALDCNLSEAIWPDVQMRFDRCRISASQSRFTMGQQYALHLVPHPCDIDFMHASIQNKRLKICSGYQGIEKGTAIGNYMIYDLNDEDGTWNDASPTLLTAADSVHWMRSYTESSDMLSMGDLLEESFNKYNTRLGFLGAEVEGDDPILNDMSEGDDVMFFRCTDRLSCQMPEYTYGGVTMEYRLNLAVPVIANYSEISARRCGSIGSLFSESTPDICRLDHELFPLFTYILTSEPEFSVKEEGKQGVIKGCLALWPKSVYFSNVRMMSFTAENLRSQLPLALLQENPAVLFCNTNSDMALLCVYLARASSIVSDEKNKNDHVSNLIGFLNSLFKDTSSVIQTAVRNGVLSTYESINLCSEELWAFTQLLQHSLQDKYVSSIASGFYIAFQFSLYEFPQQWFHQCMLSILLSCIDNSFPVVDTKLMASPVNLELPLWSSLGQLDFCSENRLRQKSGLYFMLCQGKHPEYTFSKADNVLPYTIQTLIQQEIMKVSRSKLYDNQEKTNIQCYSEVTWNCDHGNTLNTECSNALRAYYAESDACTQAPDPCFPSKVLKLGNVQLRSLSEMSSASGTTKNLADFLTSSTKSIENHADRQSTSTDYVTSLRYEMENDDSYVTLTEAHGIETSLFSGFVNTTQWMDSTCQATSTVQQCAPTQQNIPKEKPCLFQETDQYMDADRYVSSDDETLPVISIIMANGEKYDEQLCSYRGGGSSFFIFQHDLDSTLTPMDGPSIQTVTVPPGVMVRAYSTSSTEISSEDWIEAVRSRTLPDKASLVNCAWKENLLDSSDKNSWWPYAVGSEYTSEKGNGFDGFVLDFGRMSSDWYPKATNNDKYNLWKSNGCGHASAVYALQIQLETPVYSPIGASALCTYSVPYPLTLQSFKPKCNKGQRPFLVANNQNQYALWRCVPCTRFEPVVATNGFFGCTLPGGVPMDDLFTSEMLEKSFSFLYDPQALLSLVQNQTSRGLSVVQDISNGNLKVLSPINEHANLGNLENWGGVRWLETCRRKSKLWECKGFNGGRGYDASNTIYKEKILWNKAVTNPQLPFTMDCEGVKYTSRMQQECNTKTNKKLRKLSEFVEAQYRQKNGIWLQKVNQSKGVAWKANVAHSSVGKFTLFYTSGDRADDQVRAKWVLGDGPCGKISTESFLEDRVCVESKIRNLPFEPMHPWLGGDFNPFNGHKGLDECPYITSASCSQQGRVSGTSGSVVNLCPCSCSPAWACEGKQFSYNKTFMDSEFPEDEACLMQKYSDSRVMHPNDPSNLCSIIQQSIPTSRGCLLPHGLLGGESALGAIPVTSSDMHSKEGSRSSIDSKPQQLIESYIDPQTESYSSLWSGQKVPSSTTTIPFLKMGREFIHPAHIAFGLDSSMPSLPLVIKGVALLPYNNNGRKFPDVDAKWVQNLKSQWFSELHVGIEDNPDIKSITFLYPQLDPMYIKKVEGDWSCPIRKYAFIAGGDNIFGPLTPNPVSAHAIYGMGGVHPFIKAQGPYPYLAPYFTVNGACFFRKDPTLWPQISIDDIENQCGLRGMLSLLGSQIESLMSVQESFGSRCNDIIDVPDVGGKLRSGETLDPIPGLKQDCGILHRITPALISTKGNKGAVKRKGPLLHTMSPGGDCHMGRAFQIGKTVLQGKKCMLAKVGESQEIFNASCENKESYLLIKSRPLSLKELMNKKEVMYREDLKYRKDLKTSNALFPSFVGPSGVIAPEGSEEISFGMLYSACLKETLASDFLYACRTTTGCTLQENQQWIGNQFLTSYRNGTLLNQETAHFSIQKDQRSKMASKEPLLQSNINEQKLTAQLEAIQTEVDLWNQTDWTWSFLDHDKPPQGNVNKTTWLKNRTEACSNSFQDLISKTPAEMLQDKVRRISLCAPPPTGDMGTLCTSMTQYQQEIIQKNCQIWGKGDCIGKVGMFYLPYMWSSTNQEYSYVSVGEFYKEILQSKYFDGQGSFETVCSSKNDSSVLRALAALSVQQNALCPASSLEIFKDMLASLKTAGHDLLYLAYNQVMMVANIIASVFTISAGKDASFYLRTAVKYMLELFALIIKILIPLLDIIVELFGTISPIGNIMKEILIFLCEAYNWVMREIIIKRWCYIVRPVAIGILKAVQALAFISSHVVDTIQDVLNIIGDGSTETCIAFYNAKAMAKCPTKNDYSLNFTVFQPQSMATLCWANEGGGGIYTGVTQSLLSCTSSDTCALDPLLFDDATQEGLVSCGSCPSIGASSGFRFRCDTFLQRCVCGVMDDTKTECTKNYDCSVPQTSMCGVAGSLEEMRSSYVSVPCGSCASMGGMQPICVIDGQGQYGVCGCANIITDLMTCKSQQIGSPTMALFSPKTCAVILDPFKVATISQTINIQSITLDFSEIALVKCTLGSQNLCMDVSIPYSVSTGNIDMQLVVVTKLLSIVQPLVSSSGRRRLLSATDLLGHIHTENDNISKPLFNEWLVMGAVQEKGTCQGEGMTRDESKQCLHSLAMTRYIVEHFNLSGGEDLDFNFQGGTLAVLWGLKRFWDTPGLLTFIMDLDPTIKSLMQQMSVFQGMYPQVTNHSETVWYFDTLRQKGRRLLQDDPSPTAAVNRGDWSFNCTTVQRPLTKVTNAFWSTVQFYEKGRTKAVKVNQTNNCSLNTGLSDCIGYSLPPIAQATKDEGNSLFPMISAFTLYAPTMGMGGERVLDAILSPMEYEEAVRGGFITGKRILNDMSSCNYSQVTLGGEQERSFSMIFIGMFILFQIITTMCMPLSCCQWMMWYFIFPIFFFWAMYNTSPLCWPMIPTTLVHDLYMEVTYLLPQDIRVPKFLVKPHCTLNGKLADGSYDPQCFSSCSDPPFLFVSWQDSLMWWICEVSTEKCTELGRFVSNFGSLFKDMVSSSDYYASVINYSSNDMEFVQAHRLCAFFSFYQVIFLMITIVITCYLIPTIIMGIIEVFMGCVVLLMDSYIADG